jgi:hypothetical protein
MPVIDIKLNVSLSGADTQALAAELTEALGSASERTCPRVLVSVEYGALFVDGSAAPAAWVIVRSANDLLSAEQGLQAKRQLCRYFCEILERRCAVPPERVFFLVSRVLPEDTWNGTSSGPMCVADRKTIERTVAGSTVASSVQHP